MKRTIFAVLCALSALFFACGGEDDGPIAIDDGSGLPPCAIDTTKLFAPIGSFKPDGTEVESFHVVGLAKSVPPEARLKVLGGDSEENRRGPLSGQADDEGFFMISVDGGITGLHTGDKVSLQVSKPEVCSPVLVKVTLAPQE